jgi:hypothetical protein
MGSWSTLRRRSSSSPMSPSITPMTPPPAGVGESDRCSRAPDEARAWLAARPIEFEQAPILRG